jgi:hypothetical protein
MGITRQQGAAGAAVFAVAAWAVIGSGGLSSVRAQPEARTVEITIQDFAFKVQPLALKVNEPVRIVLHNVDSVQHGFTSDALDGMDVRVESEDVITYGRGIKGLYIDPAGEADLILTPSKSGALKFRCDLHPQMKGELAVLTVGAA